MPLPLPSTSGRHAPAAPPPSPPPVARRAVAAVLAATLSAASPTAAVLAASAPQPAPQMAASTTSSTRPLPPHTLPPVPPLRPFALPTPTTATLPNGLRVFALADTPDAGPTVRGALIMRGGQRASPPSALGVATLAAAVQRTGGSTAHPGASLDALLDNLSASVEVSAAPDATAVSFECASEDAAAVLGAVGELVRAPALLPEKLALAQQQVVNVLRHRDDDPAAVPGREAGRRVYGPSSVFARSPTVDQVKAVTTADVAAYLNAWQRPDAAVLTLVGDVGDVKSAVALAEHALGTWRVAPGQPSVPPPLPTSPLAPRSKWSGRKFLYDRPGAPQATVVMAAPGVTLADPAAPALDVLALSLNGFGGALFDTLRSRDGLAYSVAAGWDTSRVDHPGLFGAGGSTARPAEFLAALTAALENARLHPPSGAALADAKARALNSFVFNYATADSVATRDAAGALLGVPADYLSTYRAALEALTEADVAAAAQAHLNPAAAVVVVAADARGVRGDLGPGWEDLIVDLVEKGVTPRVGAADDK